MLRDAHRLDQGCRCECGGEDGFQRRSGWGSNGTGRLVGCGVEGKGSGSS